MIGELVINTAHKQNRSSELVVLRTTVKIQKQEF